MHPMWILGLMVAIPTGLASVVLLGLWWIDRHLPMQHWICINGHRISMKGNYRSTYCPSCGNLMYLEDETKN